ETEPRTEPEPRTQLEPRAPANGWTRINAALIPGRITNPDAQAYSFYDWAPAGSYSYKLESVGINGNAEAHNEIAGPVSVDTELVSANDLTPEAFDAATSEVLLSQSLERGASIRA